MKQKVEQNPTSRFLVGAISEMLRIILTPAYFVLRSDMGVQQAAFGQLLLAAPFYVVCVGVSAFLREDNMLVIWVFGLLVFLGFLRNMSQARRRRSIRDWSVNSWSNGRSLCEPVLLFLCRFLRRHWSHRVSVKRFIYSILKADHIYYVLEPALLASCALALRSIGSPLYFYPIVIAVGVIVARNERQLYYYLRAHEIVDGQMVEAAIKSELGAQSSGAGSAASEIARIPPTPANLAATDRQSVFDRLSPELQLLLVRDRAVQR